MRNKMIIVSAKILVITITMTVRVAIKIIITPYYH